MAETTEVPDRRREGSLTEGGPFSRTRSDRRRHGASQSVKGLQEENLEWGAMKNGGDSDS